MATFKQQTGMTIQQAFDIFHRKNPKVYELFKKYANQVFKEKKIGHVSGHTHITPLPYDFEGVTQFNIGLGDSREKIPGKAIQYFADGKQPDIQRTMVIDPFNPFGKVAIHDTPLASPSRII